MNNNQIDQKSLKDSNENREEFLQQRPSSSSGISSLFSNNNNNNTAQSYSNESRPLNAFVATTSLPSVLTLNSKRSNTEYDQSALSSYRSSAYFTASLPGSVTEENDDWLHENSKQTLDLVVPSSPSLHSMARTTSSSNYFDNQSDYEVILDDGTRQKRTISLSTVQMNSAPQPSEQPNGYNWFASISKLWNANSNRAQNHSSETLKPKDDATDNEQTPLLLSSSSSEDSSDDSQQSSSDASSIPRKHSKKKKTRRSKKIRYAKLWTQFREQYLTLSHQQKMVLKCSFAYTIGSLFTFVPQLNAMCGSHIASHMAATVTVFFNPAKTVGSMVEAAGFGWLYTLAALTLSLASMYTTDYYIDNGMPMTACCISLGVWLAGSTFVISYLKAKLNKPSVLTASGLAFIILFTVIVREGSGNEAEFNFDIITDTFWIVAIGTAISVAICVLVWPMTASKKLRININSSLSSTRILLKLLTKTFLLDADLPEFTANKTLENALKTHRASFTALKPALKEASLEFYNLDMQYHADGYKTIVASLERLAQHIGGLKSSCGLQVEVMHQEITTTSKAQDRSKKKSNYGAIDVSENTVFSEADSKNATFNLKAGPQRKKMECELKKEKQKQEDQQKKSTTSSHKDHHSTEREEASAAAFKEEGALVQFISTVGSPMKSLAYTCKQTIVHLQARFTGQTTKATPSFRLMRENLKKAIELFEVSQHKALMRFYKRKFKKLQQKNLKFDEMHSLFLKEKQTGAEDVFLVYFFVFCLLEFAKELMVLVESVQFVFEDMEESDKTENVQSWLRYIFKGKKKMIVPQNESAENDSSDAVFVPNNHNTADTLHTPAPKTKTRKFLLNLWSFFSQFRTNNFKFAVKSMLMAEAISILAFIPSTRPYFTQFKLEWTLITVMAVMTPTVGGTNLGAVLRVIATVLGCLIAACTYTLFQNNAFMLWFCTWLISIPSFWLILNHKHGRFGLFTLLAYNLIVLYKYNHRMDSSVDVFELTWRRCVAVSVGVILGLFATAYVWPYEARREVRRGLSDLLLRLSLLYKQLVSAYSEEDDDVYAYPNSLEYWYSVNSNALSRKNRKRVAALQKIELSIQVEILDLQALLVHAPNEPRLKGAFPVKTYSSMLTCCQNILDKLLSLRIVILKDVWAIHVRSNLLLPAALEFMEMAGNVFLYFYLLASALQLKTPLPPYLPPAEKTRQRLMRKIQQIPLVMESALQQELELTEEKKDECYMVYYAYVVLMENIIRELELLGDHMKDLFGSLVPQEQWIRCFGNYADMERQNSYH